MNTLPLDIDRAKTRLKCPTCKKKKRLLDTDLNEVISKASSNATIARSWVKEVQEFQWNEWGCKACVKSGKAIKADISKHTYTSAKEHYFYINKPCKCSGSSCKKDFMFTPAEQKFWYEAAKLPTDAMPEFCKTHRVDVPSKKSANKELMELLPQLNPRDPATLEKVAEMYRAIGGEEKASALLKKAKSSRPAK